MPPAGRIPAGRPDTAWSATDSPALSVRIVHPGALGVEVYRTLAAALPEAEVFALDLGALPEYAQAAPAGAPTTRIEQIADWCVHALADHPDAATPVVLVGWSFGGVIAHAIADRLPADRRPRALVLLDSIAPVASFRRREQDIDVAVLLDWFAMYLGAKRGVRLRVGAAGLAGLGLEAGLQAVLADGLATGALLAGTAYAGLRKVYQAYLDGLRRNSRLVEAYEPTAAGVPVMLLRARHGLLTGSDDLGWGELTPRGLTVATCPDNHYTMLTAPRSVALIAGAIRDAAAPPSALPAIPDWPAPPAIRDWPAPPAIRDLPAPRAIPDLPAPRAIPDLPAPPTEANGLVPAAPAVTTSSVGGPL